MADGRDNDFTNRLMDMSPALRRFARKLTHNRSDAEDLTQSCLLRALTRCHLFEPGTNLRAWLFKMMYNLYISEIRKRSAEGATVDIKDIDIAIPAAQVPTVEMGDFCRALERLPHANQQPLLLVAWEGMTYEQAAERLGVPAGTIRSRIFRTRDRLRHLLDGTASQAVTPDQPQPEPSVHMMTRYPQWAARARQKSNDTAKRSAA